MVLILGTSQIGTGNTSLGTVCWRLAVGFPGAVFLPQHQFKGLHPAPGSGAATGPGELPSCQEAAGEGCPELWGGRECPGRTGELVLLPHSPAAICVLT